MTNTAQLENAIAVLIDGTLDEGELARAGLTATIRGIVQSGEAATYQSEMTIDFFDSGDLVDVLAFAIYRGGQPIATEEQFASWLVSTLGDVVARQRTRRPRH